MHNVCKKHPRESSILMQNIGGKLGLFPHRCKMWARITAALVKLYIKHETQCFMTRWNTEKRVENTTCISRCFIWCFIYFSNKMILEGEIKDAKLISKLSLNIDFLCISLWIINEFEKDICLTLSFQFLSYRAKNHFNFFFFINILVRWRLATRIL